MMRQAQPVQHQLPVQSKMSHVKLNNGFTENVELCNPDDGLMKVLQDDEYLKPFENDLKLRQREFRK